MSMDELIGANLATLRRERGLSLRKLAERLETIGSPINVDGLNRAEKGRRQVSATELVALAIALEVTPNRLLLPVDQESVALAPAVVVRGMSAWEWANGVEVLSRAKVALGKGSEKAREGRDDFRRHALPAWLRLRDDHTAVRAAIDVLQATRSAVSWAENPSEYTELDDDDRKVQEQLDSVLSTEVADRLRTALRRLVAEVDDLIGTDDAS